MGTPEPAYHPALSNINTSNCTHTSTRSKLIHYSAASSTTMEASQHNTLQIIQNYVKTPSIEVVPPKTIKMEDITSTTTSSSLLDVPSLDCASRGAESKPTKKRKSWGQVLPEPKTNLPPRKRAKTADEKEQRRIERVKRNRLAAHNSRERKRQEVEALQMRNDQLEAHMQLMQQQIDAYRAQFPDAKVPAVPKLEKMEFDISSPPPTQPTTTPHNTHMAHFINEMPTPAPFSSPDSLLSTIDSPADTAPSTPSTSLMDGTDRTQQSAALLCDLQCQSVSSPSTSAATTTTASFISALSTIILFNYTTFTTMTTPSSTLPFTQRRKSPSPPRIPSSTRASMARRIAMALPAAIRAMLLSRLMLTTSSICSPALARSSGAATPRELRRSRTSIKQHRQHSQGTNGTASAELSARVAASLRNSQWTRSASSSSHRRRGSRMNYVNCNNSLAWDVKRSTRSIARQLSSLTALDRQNRARKVLMALVA